MNPIIRFVITLVSASLASRVGVDDVTRTRMRVLPNDLDLNLHMTNARYLAIFDIAGMEFMIRAGLGRLMVGRGLRPLIGGRMIRHRFGVRPFERFTVSTRVLCWDDKWFYLDQRMETGRGVAAVVLTKGLVRDAGRAQTVRPDELLRSIGAAREAPSITPEIARWLAAEQMLRVQDDC
ncbi:MAG: thioesterase family protein [Acetobacteraceae bacterium]|nr:thioesterase family protein [Acetobacteraceae bacterium]MBV9117583.1 thioesterase family protein [Acetobacteraceae bacterium]